MGEGVSQFAAEALVSDPRVDAPQAAHKAPGLGCQLVLLLAHSLCACFEAINHCYGCLEVPQPP